MSNAERSRRHRKDRRARGLCGWNGCHVKSGNAFHCDGHAELTAARLREYRRLKKGARAAS